MVRIAISSDNHLDVNRVDPVAALDFQARWLTDHRVKEYFFLGDLFNDFSRTRAYFTALAQRLRGRIRVHYLAGNHDMLKGVSYQELMGRVDDRYFHNQFVDLPGSDWRVLGNNGWYDYDFSTLRNRPAEVAQWKRVYWLDGAIDQPMSDPDRMAEVRREVAAQLAVAREARRRVLFLTHFAPRHQALIPRPALVRGPRMERSFQMIRALMGSDSLGTLLEDSGVVERVVYGHLHGVHPAFTSGGVTYQNAAVGVNQGRTTEWQAPTFDAQWVQRTLIMDL